MEHIAVSAALAAALALAGEPALASAQGYSIEPTFPGLRPLPGMPMEYELYRGGRLVGRLEESMPGLPLLPGLSREFDVYDRSGRRIGTAEIDRQVPSFPSATLRLDRRPSAGSDDDED